MTINKTKWLLGGLLCLLIALGSTACTWPGVPTAESTNLPDLQIVSADKLPEVINVRYRPVGRVPWELEFQSERFLNGRPYKLVGFLLSERVTGTDRVRERWIFEALIYSTGAGGNRRIELGTLPIGDIEYDSKGIPWAIHPIPRIELPDAAPGGSINQKFWDKIKPDLKKLYSLESYIAEQFNVILTKPLLPEGKIEKGESYFPRNKSDLILRIKEYAAGALARGGVFKGMVDYWDDETAILHKILLSYSSKHIEYTSNIKLKGSAFIDGLEYLYFSGSSESQEMQDGIQKTIKTSGEYFVDPYSGRTVLSKANVEEISDNEKIVSSVKYLVKYLVHLSISVPKLVAPSIPRPFSTASRPEGSIAEIYARTVDGVYTVIANDGVGSAFAIGPRHLVTNRHVVEKDDIVQLRSFRGNTVAARVVTIGAGIRDIALLETQNSLVGPILPLLPDVPMTGSQVLLIGSPIGLGGTLTTGVVSGFRTYKGVQFIQVDAAINPGNSGSPILNTRGQVIGMATLRFPGSDEYRFEGLGFGLSSLEIREFLSETVGPRFLTN